MLIANELLEAFRDSFVNLDSEPLAAVTTPKSTITFTSTGETLNHREMLDWAKSGTCYQLQDFVILKDGEANSMEQLDAGFNPILDYGNYEVTPVMERK